MVKHPLPINDKATVGGLVIDGDGADENPRSGFEEHREQRCEDAGSEPAGLSVSEGRALRISESRALPPPF